MATISFATLPRIGPAQLSTILLDPTTASRTAVIDVRDSDYIGGHIRGCQNVHTSTLDYKLPELVRSLAEKDTVVFHCMLSQQRGPYAALRYMRERLRLLGEERGQCVLANTEESTNETNGKAQKVAVLEGGFDKWQQNFGEDERLTEGFSKELWRGDDD